MIVKYIRKIIWFILGFIFSLFMYKRKYMKSKYFNGRIFGIFSMGWAWTVSDAWGRILHGTNLRVPFPVSPYNSVINYQNIKFSIDDLHNFQGSGKYFQAINGGQIIIGEGTRIANNVGIITTNHDVADPSKHMSPKHVTIGKNCWIGMNAVILPGVELGDNTVVGAGSVVTKSFNDGNCIIAGNPAKKIKDIDWSNK